jgi:nitrate reductase NapE component
MTFSLFDRIAPLYILALGFVGAFGTIGLGA